MAAVIAHNVTVEVKEELVMGLLSKKASLCDVYHSAGIVGVFLSRMGDYNEILCTIIQVWTCESLQTIVITNYSYN